MTMASQRLILRTRSVASRADLTLDDHACLGGCHAGTMIVPAIDPNQTFKANAHEAPRAALTARHGRFAKMPDTRRKQSTGKRLSRAKGDGPVFEQEAAGVGSGDRVKAFKGQNACSSWIVGPGQDVLRLTPGQARVHAGWRE